jgi:hypothetical protein
MDRHEIWKAHSRRLGLWLVVASLTFFAGVAVSGEFFSSRQNDPVLLEVYNRQWGVACSSEPYLELRVHQSGLVEGDVISGDCPGYGRQLLSPYKRKTAYLTTRQIADLTRLLNQPQLLMSKAKYPAFADYTDAGTFETLAFESFGQKKTIWLNNPNPHHEVSRANYSPALVVLLLDIEQIRNRLDPPSNTGQF